MEFLDFLTDSNREITDEEKSIWSWFSICWKAAKLVSTVSFSTSSIVATWIHISGKEL